MKKVAGFLLTMFGGLSLLLGSWYVVEAVQFIGDTQATHGKVVEHKFTHGLDTGTREVAAYKTKTVKMYAPVVEFETPRYGAIRFQASWSEGEPPAIGSEIGVRFHPERPQEARVAGISSLFGGAAIILLVGGIFGGAGILILLSSRSAR